VKKRILRLGFDDLYYSHGTCFFHILKNHPNVC
jgi:hypothetical protein